VPSEIGTQIAAADTDSLDAHFEIFPRFHKGRHGINLRLRCLASHFPPRRSSGFCCQSIGNVQHSWLQPVELWQCRNSILSLCC
jgi:hypothetical protein